MSDEYGKSHGGGHGGGGHGAGAHEEHEGAPEWLISFADNVALMMGFFVVLLAMNMKPTPPPHAAAVHSDDEVSEGETQSQSQSADMLDWAIAIREAFNNPVSAGNPRDSTLYKRVAEKKAMAERNKYGREGTERNFKTLRQSDYFGLGATIEFDTGSTTLDAAGKRTLDELVGNRKGLSNLLEVRGHASAAEAHDQPDRGMQLSYERARKTAEELVARGMEWKRLRLIACADADRIIRTTYDSAGQRVNQRVEVIDTGLSAIETPAGVQSATPAPAPQEPAAQLGTSHP